MITSTQLLFSGLLFILIVFLMFLYNEHLKRERDKKRFNEKLNIDEKWRNKVFNKIKTVFENERK